MDDPFLDLDDMVKKEEEKYKEVREYLYEHPMAAMGELISETGIDEKLINKWAREGRIEMATKNGPKNEEQDIISQFEDLLDNMSKKSSKEEEEKGKGMFYYEKNKSKK